VRYWENAKPALVVASGGNPRCYRYGGGLAAGRKAFGAALFDDLNTPEALAADHNLVTRAKALLAARPLLDQPSIRRLSLVRREPLFSE
jgi:hypothetical protein